MSEDKKVFKAQKAVDEVKKAIQKPIEGLIDNKQGLFDFMDRQAWYMKQQEKHREILSKLTNQSGEDYLPYKGEKFSLDKINDEQLAKLSDNFQNGEFDLNRAMPINRHFKNNLYQNTPDEIYDQLQVLTTNDPYLRDVNNRGKVDELLDILGEQTGKQAALHSNRDNILSSIKQKNPQWAEEFEQMLGDRRYVFRRDIENFQNVLNDRIPNLGSDPSNQFLNQFPEVSQEMKALGEDMALFGEDEGLLYKVSKAIPRFWQGTTDDKAKIANNKIADKMANLSEVEQQGMIQANYDALEQALLARTPYKEHAWDLIGENKEEGIQKWLENPKAFEKQISELGQQDDMFQNLLNVDENVSNTDALQFDRPIFNKLGVSHIRDAELPRMHSEQLGDSLVDIAQRQGIDNVDDLSKFLEKRPKALTSSLYRKYPENENLLNYFAQPSNTKMYLENIANRATELSDKEKRLWNMVQPTDDYFGEHEEVSEFLTDSNALQNIDLNQGLHNINNASRQGQPIEDILQPYLPKESDEGDFLSDTESFHTANNNTVSDTGSFYTGEENNLLEELSQRDDEADEVLNLLPDLAEGAEMKPSFLSKLANLGGKGVKTLGAVGDGMVLADLFDTEANMIREAEEFDEAGEGGFGAAGTVIQHGGQSLLHKIGEMFDAGGELLTGTSNHWGDKMKDPYAVEKKFDSNGIISDIGNKGKDIVNGLAVGFTGDTVFNEKPQQQSMAMPTIQQQPQFMSTGIDNVPINHSGYFGDINTPTTPNSNPTSIMPFTAPSTTTEQNNNSEMGYQQGYNNVQPEIGSIAPPMVRQTNKFQLHYAQPKSTNRNSVKSASF